MYTKRKRKFFQKEEIAFDEASRQAFLNTYSGSKKKKAGKAGNRSKIDKRKRRVEKRRKLLDKMDTMRG